MESCVGIVALLATLGTGPTEPVPPQLPDEPGAASEAADDVPEPDTAERPAAAPAETDPPASEPSAAPDVSEQQPQAEQTLGDPFTASTTQARDDEPSPIESERAEDRAADADEPVERFEPGQWGMTFVFGGLAPMSVGGIRTHVVQRLIMSEIGFRPVVGDWLVPFSVGAGVFSHRPEDDPTTGTPDPENDVGLSASVGLVRPFRVWRRIVPQAGGSFHLTYLEPDGRGDWLVNVSFGPLMGIEFFVADRVSLLMQATARLGFDIQHGLQRIHAATTMAFGGQMALTFYF